MSTSTTVESEFSGWRAFLWPVHSHELKKLIPMLLIIFLMNFAYNILHTMKDALVVTAKSSGAEVIPFIKVWVMFPSAILFTYLFTRMTNRLTRERVFYAMFSIFIIYYFVFTFVIFPVSDYLHPNQTADTLQALLPAGFKGFIAMFRNWTFTSFYVMSELWSPVILSLLFWGFANQVTELGEAKRFYGLFGIGANLSGTASGFATRYLTQTKFNPDLFFGNSAWEQSMIPLICLVILSSVISMMLFRWLNKNVISGCPSNTAYLERKKENKLSMRETFNYLWKSPYLMSLAFIVISYNLVINLVEVMWKHEVKELYPNNIEYNLYMSNVKIAISVTATLTALFVSGNAIRKCGWTFTAMLTPTILFITSIGFFGFFFLKESGSDIVLPFLGLNSLAIVVFFGSAQNVLSRAAKYTVFDATKEMAFVPLSQECKMKGKAAIDGVCSRLGKSGGSFIHQSLLLTLSSFAMSAPYVAGILLAVIAVWLAATKVLGNKFRVLTAAPGEQIVMEEQKDMVFVSKMMAAKQAV